MRKLGISVYGHLSQDLRKSVVFCYVCHYLFGIFSSFVYEFVAFRIGELQRFETVDGECCTCCESL